MNSDASQAQPGAEASREPSLEEISKQLENPLTTTWSLVLQNNTSLMQGESVEGRPMSNTFFFQPALHVPVGKSVLIARPVFPVIS